MFYINDLCYNQFESTGPAVHVVINNTGGRIDESALHLKYTTVSCPRERGGGRDLFI